MAELSTLARPYAKAAFEYAAEAGELSQWAEMLATLAAVTREPVVRQLLESPNYTSDMQVKLLLDLTEGQLNRGVTNLVTALGQNRRLPLLPVIREQFDVMKANREKSIDVEVKTASPIDQLQQENLAEALSKRLDRSVKISVTLDKTLLGGALIRAGDTIIDGSIRGRLVKLAEALNS